MKRKAPHGTFRTLGAALASASLTCALLTLSVFAAPALADAANPGNVTLDYEPEQNDTAGVSDFSTDIKILKVDAQDNDPVAYAWLQIRDKATGEVVVQPWRTGTTPTELSTVLDVDTTYILEETNAPRGYAVADPVEFTIAKYDENEMKESVLTILTGTDHARAQDKSTLVLTDERTPEYRTELRNQPESDTRPKSGLAQTGDLFNPVSTLAIALVGGTLIILGIRATRSKRSADPDHSDRADRT